MSNREPSSHGLWAATAPPPPLTSPLLGVRRVEVAIVGAGFTGLSAALHLALGGRDVAVVEDKDIGFGGSGRNVGLVNAGLWIMPNEVPKLLGDVYGPRLIQELGAAPALVFDLIKRFAIDCHPVPAGTLHGAVGAHGLKEIEDRTRQWQALGAPVRMLDKAAAAKAIGTHSYEGALIDDRAGTIEPLAYVRGLARAAQAAGATIHTDSRATSIEDLGQRWRVNTPQGSLEAQWVIVATDAYSKDFLPMLQQELVRLPYFQMSTPPLSDNLAKSILPGREGVWDTEEILTSFRFDHEGRFVFGSVGALRGSGEHVHRNWSRRAIGRLFPQLREVTFEHAWYGWIGMTDDALPRLHQLGRNLVSLGGYNGRGIAPGTALGRAVARWILGELEMGDLPLPVSPLRRDALKPIKELAYEIGAQIVHFGTART